MISIRTIAACIGVTGSFSILSDFYGFWRGRIPQGPTGRLMLSLKQHVSLLQGKHYHLNTILVGSNNFTDSDLELVDYAIHMIHVIYSQVNMGVGRVEHYYITVADAGGLDSPTTEDQLEELTNTWTVPNDGIDVFIPHNMNVPGNNGVILGKSVRGGPCGDKQAVCGMTGSVFGLWNLDQIARTFSHEVGHYLGQDERNDDHDNLMCQSRYANSIRNSVILENYQGDAMKDHCMVKPGC